jgi:8-oxo-dGTP pyrophosphatase MutT (NUDIX family)/phosphohistidine phosphatase SixA
MTAGVVVAGGGVLWRGDPLDPEVVLVHRPAYDDWSLPKGKAKPGEHVLVAAIREVAEETGHLPRIGPHLTEVRYLVRSGGRSTRKVVSYWSMRAAGGDFVPSREVDEIRWLPLRDARRTLTAARDRDVLDVFARTPRDTTPIMLVRHAATASTSSSSRGGSRLNRAGRIQASALVPILEGLGVTDLVSADVPSCVETLRPVASATGLPVHRDADLARAAFLGNEHDVVERVRRSAVDSDGLVVCAQQPVLVGLLAALGQAGRRRRRQTGIKKGGWWLVHQRDGVVHAVERFQPAA